MSRLDGRTIWRAWKLVGRAGVDIFDPEAPALLSRIPGWSALRLPASGLLGQPRVSVLDSLRALALLAAERPRDEARAKLVATLPQSIGGVLATRDIARGLIAGAQRELLVMGFAMSEIDFRELLIRRGIAGVRVTVVGDRVDRGASEIRTHWPPHAAALTALEDVEAIRGERRRMHAKVIVADRRTALVGSANFTFSGLARNLEVGVQVEGEVAEEICRMVEELARTGWLVAESVPRRHG